MEFKGTKGRWTIVNVGAHPDSKREQIAIIQTKTHAFDLVAVEFNDLRRDTFKANAQLISKAPEMLEMLIELRETFDFSYPEWGNAQGLILSEKLDNLIKEATTI